MQCFRYTDTCGLLYEDGANTVLPTPVMYNNMDIVYRTVYSGVPVYHSGQSKNINCVTIVDGEADTNCVIRFSPTQCI